MNGSILTTIKQLVGISEEDTSFDINIIMHINSVFGIISQLGLQEADSFTISDKETTWDSFTKGRTDLEFVKTYVYMKVKIVFDPPTSSAALNALNRSIDESEWRICNLYKVQGGDINGS